MICMLTETRTGLPLSIPSASMRIAFLGTYLPRKCGIATFTTDLRRAVAEGSDEPLIATGAKADQICAFARRYQEDVLIVAVARFPLRSEADRDWTETKIPWAQVAVNQTHWRDLFGGRVVVRHREGVGVEAVLGNMPVAALVPDNSGYSEA